MTLHQNEKLFSDTLRACSRHLNIRIDFIEKDYWITLVLKRLAASKFVNEAVFKGGTSLSKGYNLIERFSTDVDIAIINQDVKSGNKIKTIIRKIEKEIAIDLQETSDINNSSKGSKFRKALFEYKSIDNANMDNKLILEINAFANPYLFQQRTIKSFVFDFLSETANESLISTYQLQPFVLNVLNLEQTLIEKMVSLIRFSFDSNPIEAIGGKIRHFYDLYFLTNSFEGTTFITSSTFKQQFDSLLQHDKAIFDEPVGWQVQPIESSPLIKDFESVWKRIKDKYRRELSALSYREIPKEEDIAINFITLIKHIQ